MQAKKRTIQIVLPSGGAAAARQRHRAMQHLGYIGRESCGLLLDSAHIQPAASQMRPCWLWETQAVTDAESLGTLPAESDLDRLGSSDVPVASSTVTVIMMIWPRSKRLHRPTQADGHFQPELPGLNGKSAEEDPADCDHVVTAFIRTSGRLEPCAM